MSARPVQTLYLSHGGGPLPLLGDESHSGMLENLQAIAGKLRKPSAILLVSAHWEEDVVSITSAAEPGLIYDYYGFPEESYSIQYPCPGFPQLAKQVHEAIQQEGIDARLDAGRGFDHGMFVPLKIMYPAADIPCVQVSLQRHYDPKLHINIGKVLSRVASQDTLIIGSGFSFHNMQAFFGEPKTNADSMNEAFESWLIETCSSREMDESQRMERLLNWDRAPHARFCHPREEHLMPLHVCYGARQSACTEHFEVNILRKKSSTYLWQ